MDPESSMNINGLYLEVHRSVNDKVLGGNSNGSLKYINPIKQGARNPPELDYVEEVAYVILRLLHKVVLWDAPWDLFRGTRL
uniref:HDC03517 n=1 Tax=Drosophila melanogaster TaxID=7227 RepID=Q6IH29_DROME|nr:TPA_inf: HDC03517 [Drosophila melanogaster]